MTEMLGNFAPRHISIVNSQKKTIRCVIMQDTVKNNYCNEYVHYNVVQYLSNLMATLSTRSCFSLYYTKLQMP